MRKYIVQLEGNLYLAPWEGDPGRTLKYDSAMVFKNKKQAKKELIKARKFRKFENAEIIEIS